MANQIIIQWFGVILIMLIGLRWILKQTCQFTSSVINLDLNGHISLLKGELMETKEGQWVITHKSKICGPFVCLVLLDNPLSSHTKHVWLCKDQMLESDFRRFCRTIIRCQQQPIDVSN